MLRLFIPLLVGQTVIKKPYCAKDMSKTSQPVSNQIRALMWPVLLIALGFAWYLTQHAISSYSFSVDAMYAITTALISWWLHVHFCEEYDSVTQTKGNLIMLLVAGATAGLVYFAGEHSVLASTVLSVVLIWLIFAERIEFPKIQLPSIKIRLPKIKVQLPKLDIEGGGLSVNQ